MDFICWAPLQGSDQQAFSVKVQKISILGFASHDLCSNYVTGSYIRGWRGGVSVKLGLQEQERPQ